MDVKNPFQDVIDWLESAEGGKWSRRVHHIQGAATWLLSVKVDGDKGMPESLLWWYLPEPSMLVDEYDSPI